MTLKCMGCKKAAITIFDGAAVCLNHYAYLLAQKQYVLLLDKRNKTNRKRGIPKTPDESLPFPNEEELQKKYLALVKEIYGGKRGRKSSNKL